ncbi:MAG: hypothetical protein IKC87_01770 [Clostridia bacterium]|nr:hypothetical protein [Clostridia bacterium]
MKKRFLLVAVLLLIAATAVILTSCSQWANPYDVLDGEGASISVKFLAGEGGLFASTTGVTVVDVFNLGDYTPDGNGKVSIPLIKPDDPKRGNDAFDISKNGHILAGWFVAEEVDDGNGGKTYKPTRKWNFATDKLTLDASGDYSANTPSLTLMAVWMPYVNFEFYADVDGTLTKVGEKSGMSIDIPEWNLDNGRMNYKSFLELDGKTFKAAYSDEAMTEAITNKIEGKFDYDNGVTLTPTIKIYTEWIDGEWFKISSANQLSKNASATGCYEILGDLEFGSGILWPQVFVNNEFSGQFIGNGHTVSGITTGASLTSGGDVSHGAIFGALSDKALIKDLTFTGVSYTVNTAVRPSTADLGILAGTNNGATLENVSLTESKLVLSDKLFTLSVTVDRFINGSFKAGLVFADGDTEGVSITNVTLEGGNSDKITATVGDKGVITFTVPETE